MPRLPGVGLGLASGLGRAALHDATALVTTLPWLEGCDVGADELALSWAAATALWAEPVPR